MQIVLFTLGALFSLLAAQVAADGDSDRKQSPDSNYDEHPGRYPVKPQVLWGQCDGYYYTGTKKCPPGAYCRWFSDWYSQCNPIGD